MSESPWYENERLGHEQRMQHLDKVITSVVKLDFSQRARMREDGEETLDRFMKSLTDEEKGEYIGRVFEEKGDIRSAVDYYQRFVKEPGVDIGSRELAVQRLRVLKAILNETEAPAATVLPSGEKASPCGVPAPAGTALRRKSTPWLLA